MSPQFLASISFKVAGISLLSSIRETTFVESKFVEEINKIEFVTKFFISTRVSLS